MDIKDVSKATMLDRIGMETKCNMLLEIPGDFQEKAKMIGSSVAFDGESTYFIIDEISLFAPLSDRRLENIPSGIMVLEISNICIDKEFVNGKIVGEKTQ